MIRVACASNYGELLDGHFGSCRRFLIYEVSPTGYELIGSREAVETSASIDKNSYRASLVADCHILMVVSIGAPAAAKVVKAGIHPIKKEARPAKTELKKLQQVLTQKPPPWLAKVMGQTAEERIRFRMEEAA